MTGTWILEIAEMLALPLNQVREILALPEDDCYDENGRAYPRGRCDTCGAPCDDDEGLCTADQTHEVAKEA